MPGIAVNLGGFEGKTALAWAAQEGQADSIAALLAASGIDANLNGRIRSNGPQRRRPCGAGRNAPSLSLRPTASTPTTRTTKASARSTTAAATNNTECMRALVATKGIRLGHRDSDGWTALHRACQHQNAEAASLLLAAGGCRFALSRSGAAPLALAGGNKHVRAVFLSGIDYWRRMQHNGHSSTMKQVVVLLLLIRQRLDARPPTRHGAAICAHTASATDPRPRLQLPEDMWLLVCGLLRSADFAPGDPHLAPSCSSPAPRPATILPRRTCAGCCMCNAVSQVTLHAAAAGTASITR